MSDFEDHGREDRSRSLVAEYVLGLLPPGEHARLDRLISESPALRAERDQWVAHFAALDEEFAESTAPANAFRVVENRLFGASHKTAFWDNLWLWRGLAAGALAVAVVAVGFNLARPAADTQALANQLVAMLEEDGSDVRFVAFYDGAGNVRLTGLSGSAVAGRDYELWAIQGEQAPVSMGVIPVDARSSVTISPEVQAGWDEGSVLAVTLEPQGGAPEGIPTGPIVAKGAVTRI
jgi:anti-sigma-K factor RskA